MEVHSIKEQSMAKAKKRLINAPRFVWDWLGFGCGVFYDWEMMGDYKVHIIYVQLGFLVAEFSWLKAAKGQNKAKKGVRRA